jgi:hypothetical protein
MNSKAKGGSASDPCSQMEANAERHLKQSASPSDARPREATEVNHVNNIVFLAESWGNEASHANRVAAQAHCPRLHLCFRYWLSKRNGNGLPGRCDIDPIEMERFLPSMNLFQVEHNGGARRFLIRLAGTNLVEILGRDVTGAYVDQICAPETHGLMGKVVETRQACYGGSRVPIPGREFEHLTLPLASDGARVDMLLSALCRLGRADDLR